MSRLGLISGFWLLLAPAAAIAVEPAELALRLQPHRVIYSLVLKTLDTTGGVVDARGAISYEFAETCDGWTTKHTFRLGLTRQDSNEKMVRTDYTSWESKDGLNFRFTTRTLTDGQETENRSGRATLDSHGGPGRAIVEGKGARKDIALPRNTTFPTWHTLVVLAGARNGEPIIWRHMFDGSNEGKITGIHVVIKDEVPAQRAALFDQPGWRFRASYFDPPQADKNVPTYRIIMTITEGGVTTAMVLDYDDFELESKVERIEPLPRARCN